MDGLAKYFRAELQFSKKQVRALVDFFDANGDGEIEPDEFSDVIKQVNWFSSKGSSRNKCHERFPLLRALNEVLLQ